MKSPGEASVFVSYSRRASCSPALSIARQIEDLVFLDSADILTGEDFVERILDALLASRIVIAFVGSDYFNSRFCQLELDVAYAAYEQTKDDADLDHLILALPHETAKASEAIDQLPAPLRKRNWPLWTESDRLVDLIRGRLSRSHARLSDRLRVLGLLESVRQNVVETELIPAATTGVFGAVPDSLGKRFVGRDRDLWPLHRSLWSTPGTPGRKVVLYGIPGVGKSQLAAEYAHRYRRYYPGGVFWIPGETGKSQYSLMSVYHSVLRNLSGFVKPLETYTEADLLTQVSAALDERSQSDRCLIIVDSLPDQPAESKPLPTPSVSSTTVLVTCRRSSYPGLTFTKRLEVSELDESEGARVLVPLHGHPAAIEERKLLAKWVHGHPLCLSQLSSLLEDPGQRAELLEIARSSDAVAKTLDDQAAALHADEGSPRITEVFRRAFRDLPETSAKLLSVLSLVGQAPLPIELVTRIGSKVLNDRSELSTARGFLVARAVLSPLADGDSYQLHALYADVVRSLEPSENRLDPFVSYMACTSALLELLVEFPSPEEHRQLVLAALPHAEDLVKRPTWGPGFRITRVELLFQVAKHYAASRLYEDTKRILKVSVKQLGDPRYVRIVEGKTGKPYHEAETARAMLAAAYANEGKLAEAVAMQLEVVANLRLKLGPKHRLIAVALRDLAKYRMSLQDIAAALKDVRQGLSIKSGIEGELERLKIQLEELEVPVTFGDMLAGCKMSEVDPGNVSKLSAAARSIFLLLSDESSTIVQMEVAIDEFAKLAERWPKGVQMPDQDVVKVALNAVKTSKMDVLNRSMKIFTKRFLGE